MQDMNDHSCAFNKINAKGLLSDETKSQTFYLCLLLRSLTR